MAKRRTDDRLTPLELEIMKVLWETSPATVHMVQERLSTERPLAYTTVQTMLNVLHRKGKVTRALKDRAHHYRPTVNRAQAAKQAVGDVINRLFGGSPESLVLSLVETKHLKREQLNELYKLLNERGDADDDQ